MEQEVKAAARKLIARMSQMAMRDEDPVGDVAHYQSLLAQLSLAQLALTYPKAILGTCAEHDGAMHFEAGEDGLYVRCTADPQHGFKIGGV